ncbi:alpha-1,4-glucan--maltose-1-phosphate maltosyltransferase [Acidipropionibacterium timonense]|uniref:alpha-1,4-glucan--maltose-1-phosphate maltosyltransferase n=1 Tax=Acidipropionibacterium timonense TaxID=2161818 RepID=UPI001FD8FF98|nr:alpha-1,4-glucan--maltose-1-phosphate maltosyltransferase [Acidipropionibacterium timonense]
MNRRQRSDEQPEESASPEAPVAESATSDGTVADPATAEGPVADPATPEAAASDPAPTEDGTAATGTPAPLPADASDNEPVSRPRHAADAPEPESSRQDLPLDRPGHAPLRGYGRIPVHNVQPVVEGGRLPAYAVVGEEFEVRANVFREGHDAVGASVVLTDADGRRLVTDMVQVEPIGLDIWTARVSADAEGDWTMHVEGWSDAWGTWHHNAAAKLAAGIDVDLVCAEGRVLVTSARDRASSRGDEDAVATLDAAGSVLDPNRPIAELLGLVEDAGFAAAMRRHADRPLTSPTARTPLVVERRRALYGSWYEFFPRSQGAHENPDGSWTSGTFDSSWERLDAAAAMGFDVVYLPPIHPIGTAFRKGRDNTLVPGPYDPGSPWAIGSADGGHDAIHPDLGTFEDFDRFVGHAHDLGLEVALDFALQASPDHPWVTEHPEWFTTRVDGTIAYAENPPKKYQDIYPINFDNDPEGIHREVIRLLELWISHGVTIFRVDNPHTKPVNFWAWVMATMHRRHPEVIFLAEAFTRPEMMQALAKVGFQQGYSYFTWRTAKWEIEEFLTQVSRDTSAWYRPNMFVNTPDINPYYLQDGNPAGFAIRAILAATMSPSWGVYSGFELCEHEPLPGREEYAHSEKYEYRPRDWNAQPNLSLLITRLNEIRRAHPALQQLRDVTIHHAPDDRVLVFSKKAGDDVVIVVVSLDPVWGVGSQVMLDMAALGLDQHATFDVHDELTGADFTWSQQAWVGLYPSQPAHILSVRRP